MSGIQLNLMGFISHIPHPGSQHLFTTISYY